MAVTFGLTSDHRQQSEIRIWQEAAELKEHSANARTFFRGHSVLQLHELLLTLYLRELDDQRLHQAW